ncbi:MAG: hypothetical protein JAY65_19285, partial [Candidatus Thiodiazotropha endolucinida]|nr:hypothetical protein [Candidatus Thiodiazotropha taylori]MCG8108843.1 hypothetical protein [Candidatus Thiodiazotropha taylori]MCW4281179.1 hypothetical protein [Candidatus Thiodiazotropha taylori]MCW4303808.1 hypothetical protein [Candidatus Thiodiazotropha taylori]
CVSPFTNLSMSARRCKGNVKSFLFLLFVQQLIILLPPILEYIARTDIVISCMGSDFQSQHLQSNIPLFSNSKKYKANLP